MDLELARFNMVEQQVRPCDVFDKDVLALLFSVKRENFVVDSYKNLAFSDLEIPLPGQQKMLCPRIEAKLVQELTIKKTDKVLEIGSGSGYVTALLAKLANFVYAVEIDESNRQLSLTNLSRAGVSNASISLANGLHNTGQHAPYDKIFVGGGLVSIPNSLKNDLQIGGKLVGFVGVKPVMRAVLIERLSADEYHERYLFETDIDYLISEQSHSFKF